jgi:two-component system, response regulator, stage 0 sporulation protein F
MEINRKSPPRSDKTSKPKKGDIQPGTRPPKYPDTLRVLVVEDDFTIKVLVTTMLELNGCRVDQAANGTKALGCMATQRYDLVLADMYMPVMNGRDLADEIRSQWPDTKIAIMTGASEKDVQSMTAAGQADTLLFKPFGMKEIRWLINHVESL